MSAETLHTALLVAEYILACLLVAWLCLQMMMWLVSCSIRRILDVRKQTACNYLKTGRFWKDKNNHYVWYLKGPGMAALAKKVLAMARREVREDNLRSNVTLYGQCYACIFMAGCSQKYEIRCNHCVIYRHCSFLRHKKNKAICRHFRCMMWIERD